MIGRRLPVRPDGTPTMPELPGDYCGPVRGQVSDPSLQTVFFLKPNARDPDAPKHARSVQHVVSPPHVFTEMPDGSLEIRESISDHRARQPDLGSDGWHGYLDRGHVWRRVGP